MKVTKIKFYTEKLKIFILNANVCCEWYFLSQLDNLWDWKRPKKGHEGHKGLFLQFLNVLEHFRNLLFFTFFFTFFFHSLLQKFFWSHFFSLFFSQLQGWASKNFLFFTVQNPDFSKIIRNHPKCRDLAKFDTFETMIFLLIFFHSCKKKSKRLSNCVRNLFLSIFRESLLIAGRYMVSSG